jgi:hypothetical protein
MTFAILFSSIVLWAFAGGDDSAQRATQGEARQSAPSAPDNERTRDLRPIDVSGPMSLTMNNQPVQVIYDTIGKLFGVNVAVDPGVNRQILERCDYSNTTLEESLDAVAMATGTVWKPVGFNSIVVKNERATGGR